MENTTTAMPGTENFGTTNGDPLENIPVRELTFGERAVGMHLAVSNLPEIQKIKRPYADAIDQLNDLRNASGNPDVKRLCATAITQSEIACLCAVKAITWA